MIEWFALFIGCYVICRVAHDIYLDYKRGNKGYYEVSGIKSDSDLRMAIDSINRMHEAFPEMRFFINGRRVLFPGDQRPRFGKVFGEDEGTVRGFLGEVK